MEFWNYVHNSFGIHVSVLLFLILAAIMVVIALIHHRNQTKRESGNNEELERLRKQPESSPAPEKQAEAPAVEEAKE